MKHIRNIDFFRLFIIVTFWLPISIIIVTIGTLYCGCLVGSYNDKILVRKSVSIICKLREYQQVQRKLPSSLSQLMNGSGWWDELQYRNDNDRDFTLSISNGFDSTAIYHSTENEWELPNPPFPFQQESVRIDCNPE